MVEEANNTFFLKLLDELEECIENDRYLAALFIALTIPDICGKAEYPQYNNTKRYICWYNDHFAEYKPSDPYGSDMPYLSGEVIYNLRNSLLHQGNPNIAIESIKEERCKINNFELVFSKSLFDGGISSVSYDDIKTRHISRRTYSVNVRILCSSIHREAKAYWESNREKFNFFDCKIRVVPCCDELE